jgi:hypothetical protein
LVSDGTKVVVFIDWQNVYLSAREAFGLQRHPKGYGNFSPFRLSRILTAANGRGSGGNLVGVEVFRGPSGIPAITQLSHRSRRGWTSSLLSRPWELHCGGVVTWRSSSRTTAIFFRFRRQLPALSALGTLRLRHGSTLGFASG